MKTILDAVNTLKGVWPSESIQIIEIDGVEFSEKEFNDCVDECANNFGLPSVTAIDWSKAPKNCDGYSVSSCMNGYWHLDNETLTPAPDFGIREIKFFHRVVAKPVYTQTMCDAGELPSVGSEFVHDGGIVTTISTSEFDGGVVTFSDGVGSIGCCWNNDAWVNAIDNRTPKEKADDLFKLYLKGDQVSTHKSFSQAAIDGDFGDNIKWVK